MAFPIQNYQEIIYLPDFWLTLRRSESRLLVLDYDGTLAPFHAERMKAHPLPGIREILGSIAEGRDTSLAIVSGRPIHELINLLEVDDTIYVGNHGFEQMKPNGQITARSPSPSQLEALARAQQMAIDLGLGNKLEVKAASMALHTRGMPPLQAAETEKLVHTHWSRLDKRGLQILKFNGGIELRASGRNKGDVLIDLANEAAPESLTVYIGDDATDEDAFRVLRGRGVGIKVGDSTADTAAVAFLQNCQAVRDFLAKWLLITSREGG